MHRQHGIIVQLQHVARRLNASMQDICILEQNVARHVYMLKRLVQCWQLMSSFTGSSFQAVQTVNTPTANSLQLLVRDSSKNSSNSVKESHGKCCWKYAGENLFGSAPAELHKLATVLQKQQQHCRRYEPCSYIL